MKTITCENCAKTYSSESLRKICSNCFLCTGCEIYRCPNCQEEIIITPLDIGNYNQMTTGGEEADSKG